MIFNKQFHEQIYLACFVAVLSFAGAAAGTFVAAQFDQSKWQRETRFVMKKEILGKRMELVERTMKAIHQLQVLDLYYSAGAFALLEGEELVRSNKQASPSLDAALTTAARVKDAQSELATVITLDAIYFGPKTKEAAATLENSLKRSETWWKVSPAKTQALLNAVTEELQLGLD
jgi:hypothetical protein